MSLLFDIALLQRPGRLDVLSALRDAPVIRDRRDDVELFREIAKRIGVGVDAHPGTVAEVLRRRLVQVADSINVMEWPTFDDDARIDSWDLVSDRQLLNAIAERFFNEVAAITAGVPDIGIPPLAFCE